MRITRLLLLVAAVTACFAAQVMAQAPSRASPHETFNFEVDGRGTNSRVTVTYGRPYSKAPRGGEVRKIWGGLVPYGKAWRLGADEATTLITQKSLEIGGTTIPPGAYTLYMIPEEKGGKLAFSKTLGGWGIPVDEKNDLARVDLKVEALEKDADQLGLAFDKGVLKIMWEKTQYSVPIAVKK